MVIGDNSGKFFIFGKPGGQVIPKGSLILATTGFNGASEWFCVDVSVSSLAQIDRSKSGTWYYILDFEEQSHGLTCFRCQGIWAKSQ